MKGVAGLTRTALLLAAGCLLAGPAFGKLGQEIGPPITAADMQGRRVPNYDFQCGWMTSGLIIGLGEKAEFRVLGAEDEDIYYDPYPIWDPLVARWEFYDSDMNQVYPAGLEIWVEEHSEPMGETVRLSYDFYAKCLFRDKGWYTAKCLINDVQSDPKADDPEIHKSVGADVRFDVRILQVFSTDGSSMDPAAPQGGTVGMEIEWTAGFRPELSAEHVCSLRSSAQHNYQWKTMEEEITCDFPNKGKYCWNTTPGDCYDLPAPPCRPLGCRDNEGWTQVARLEWAGDKQVWVAEADEGIELQNLTIENVSPPYLIYDPDAQSPQNTITYKLKDGWDIYPPGQETTVRVEILSSDGTPVKTEQFLKTASRSGTQYPYVWDGKNDAGELMPKGIYVYRITGTQNTGEGTVLDPTAHVDADCEKSWWEIGNTQAEMLDYNEDTEMATMRVSFYAGPAGDYPGDLKLNAEGDYRPYLEVYDPDLVRVAEARAAGDLPVHQRIEFPDVQVPLNKSGEYTFLVSAWDSRYLDYCPDKAHRERPLLQHNTRINYHKLAVMLDPGHGAVMVNGETKHRGGTSTDPDGVFSTAYESDIVLDIAARISAKLAGKKHIASVDMTRRDQWDIGPDDRSDTTVGDYEPANYERVERLKRFIQRNYDHHVVFISVHTNAPRADAPGYYSIHGTGEENPLGKTWLGSYMLAMLTCDDPTITQLLFAGPWIGSNLVLNQIKRIPDDPEKKLKPVPATLVEVAFHTNWRACARTDEPHHSFGCPRQPENHWLEARRLRNDADSGNADFLNRVALCFEDGCWFYWAIAVNSLKRSSSYPCLTSFTHWP